MKVIWIGAHPNNYGSRLNHQIKYVILHWIAGTLASADATFLNSSRRASAHYGVADGVVHQYVEEKSAAWHCGNLTMNRESVGIENEGGPDIPITEATYQTCAALVKEICDRYKIPLDRDHIKGHKEVSDKPTACPGTLDIDKVIRLAKGQDDMTETEVRILQFVSEQGLSEGDVREAVGLFKDKAGEKIANLEKGMEALNGVCQDLEKRLADLEAKLSENQLLLEDWQKIANSANQKATKISKENEELRAEVSTWKSRYENKCKETADKLTSWELFKLLIQSLKQWKK